MASSIVQPKSKGSFTLWFAVVAPPLLWITQLAVGGELPEVACSTGLHAEQHARPGHPHLPFDRERSARVARGCLGPDVPAQHAGPGAIQSRDHREERGYFMALLGLVSSLFFLLLMVVSAVADLRLRIVPAVTSPAYLL